MSGVSQFHRWAGSPFWGCGWIETRSPVRLPPDEARGQQRPAEPERLRLKLRPMSEAEAISELEADSQAVVVYLDEDSGEIQILVRRADGSLAVIEPVVP